MLTAQTIESRKKEIAAMDIDKRRALWLSIHKQSELYNNLFGGAAIVCAAVSSQLDGHPTILLITGLTAAVSTAMVTFLNLKGRAVTYINAWRILDKARSTYLSHEDATLDSVGDALNQAEEYIQGALHRM